MRKAMGKARRRARFMIIGAILSLMTGIASQVSAWPVKVFIMAGQSNMEGHARVTTLDYEKAPVAGIPETINRVE